MPIQLLDQSTLQKRTETAFANLANEFNEAQQKWIRERFDNKTNVDSSAIALIQLAEEEQYFDLADEMKADFYTETGLEVA